MEAMDPSERLRQVMNLEACLQDNSMTPWWVVDVVRVLGDLVHENDGLCKDLKQLNDKLSALEKSCTRLETQYSELLYRLKTGD